MANQEIASVDILQQTIEKFWETIPPVWGRIRNNVRGIATEEFGISVEQFHVLRHIRKGIVTVSNLAEIRQISRPAVSQAVEALVVKGLVSRTQNTGDRRYVALELTESGSALLNAIFKKNRAWMAEKMAGLTMEELESLVPVMGMLKKVFDPSID